MPRTVLTALHALVGCILAICLSLSPASATEPGPNPTASWDGFYLGVHGGYSAADFGGVFDSSGHSPYASFASFNTDGLNGGIHGGFNLSVGGLIVGLEGDYSWDGKKGSTIDGENDLQSLNSDYFATVRGRVGAATDNLLVYMTAGVAFTEIDLSVENGEDGYSFNATGLAYGAGVEYKVMPGVSIKAEAMRLDFSKNFKSSDQTNTGSGGRLDGLSDGDDDDHLSFKGVNVFRIGVNVRPGALSDGKFSSKDAVNTGAATNFAGFYLGGNAGYSQTDVGGQFDAWGDVPTADFASFDLNSANGGIQAGFNFQSGAIVYGIEADYSWLNASDSFVDGENDRQALDVDYFATVRGRLGVVSNNILIYATAGAVFSKLNLSVEDGTDGLSLGATGVAYGGGIEVKVANGFTIKAEYLRLDFNEAIGAATGSALDNLRDGDDGDTLNFDGHDVIRLGVNIHLGSLFSKN